MNCVSGILHPFSQLTYRGNQCKNLEAKQWSLVLEMQLTTESPCTGCRHMWCCAFELIFDLDFGLTLWVLLLYFRAQEVWCSRVPRTLKTQLGNLRIACKLSFLYFSRKSQMWLPPCPLPLFPLFYCIISSGRASGWSPLMFLMQTLIRWCQNNRNQRISGNALSNKCEGYGGER